MCKRFFLSLVLPALFQLGLSAGELHFAHIFTDGMVLQRGESIPVWGWGAVSGKKVIVEFGNNTYVTRAAKDGSWRVMLPSEQVNIATANAGKTITVKCGKETAKISDVLIGDVYLCSGQSNMELPIRRCMDSVADVVKNIANPNIRYVKIPHTSNYLKPNEDLPKVKWQDIKPSNCSDVGALCYFMAKKLQEKSGVPVGIINSSVGGTPVQAWTPKEVLMQREEYKNEFNHPKYNRANWVDSLQAIEYRAGGEWERTMAKECAKELEYHPVTLFSNWSKGNGLYFFRNKFKVDASIAGKRAVIRLGAIRDADSVFVNGTFVGTTSYQYPPRIYTIPSGVLREGENEVVIRLISEHGTPYFVPQKRYDLETEGKIIPLNDNWEMAIGKIMPEKQNYTYFVAGYNGLYNAMIAPLRNIPFKAAVWYQGEANIGDAPENYASLLKDMVTSWRKQWQKEFPFVIVQLPYFETDNPGAQRGWGIVQYQQELASKIIDNACLVDIRDTGEPNDIHPQDKMVVGSRCADALLGIKKDVSVPLRLLNHWDNPNGTIERGFAGHSIWKWDAIPCDVNIPLPDSLVAIYNSYGQTNLQLGINGTVLNNVNAKPAMLSTEMLQKTRRIADILRPYGLKVYLSVNFASPKALGDTETADPLDAKVVEWWKKKADEIYTLIPDFGGFLVKANSEGEPGPMDYNRTHVDGANMLADALKPHGGIVMWRAFVYSPQGGDRASQAYDEFVRFDGQFRDNVIIQIKNGPIDFQPREAVSPLFFALKKTKMMAELQITQEYTGHNIMTCFLAPEWREFIDTINAYKVPLVGFAGVSNIGDECYRTHTSPETDTFNPMTKANWYAFGMLANDTTATAERIARTYLEREWSRDERFLKPVTKLLLDSYEALVSYTMPLGLHHIFAGGHHYGPEPWCYHKGWREDWLPRYYHKADSVGIGFDRTSNGSKNALQYPEPLRSIYNDINRCPENLILWFHHVEWKNIWDKLCHTYDKGVAQAEGFVETWKSIEPYIDKQTLSPTIFRQQLKHFEQQASDAWWWRDGCLLYFFQFSKMPLPADCPKPRHDLNKMMKFSIGIDNYTAVPLEER